MSHSIAEHEAKVNDKNRSKTSVQMSQVPSESTRIQTRAQTKKNNKQTSTAPSRGSSRSARRKVSSADSGKDLEEKDESVKKIVSDCGERDAVIKEEQAEDKPQQLKGKESLSSLLGKLKTPLSTAQHPSTAKRKPKLDLALPEDHSTNEQRQQPTAEQSTTEPEEFSENSPEMLKSGFSSLTGTCLSVTKAAIEISRKLCLEDEDDLDAPPLPASTRKRLAVLPHVETKDNKAFKMPRLKALQSGMDASLVTETDPVGRETCQEASAKDTVPTRRVTFADELSHPETGQKSVPASRRSTHHPLKGALKSQTDKSRLAQRRSRQSWRPSVYDSKAEDDIYKDESETAPSPSPLEQLSARAFDASKALSPELTASYVFSNGVNTLTMYGALSDVGLKPTFKWVKQQYRWVVWHLSGFVSESFNPLTADNAFLELKYRLRQESTDSKSSILQSLAKTEEKASVVLLVADIVKEDENRTKIELSDGWSSIMAEVDSGLQTTFQSGTIQIGTLLFVSNLAVTRMTAEAPAVQLKRNACRVVPSATPVGKASDSAFYMPLNTINETGGAVSIMLLCVHRMYPVLYAQKQQNEAITFLSHEQYQQRTRDYNKEMEHIRSAAVEMVRETEKRYYTTVMEKEKKREQVDQDEVLFARHLLTDLDIDSLNNEQLLRLDKFKQKHDASLEECIQQQMKQLIVDWGTVKASEVPRLQLLVTDASMEKPSQPSFALLNIWTKRTPLGKDIHEGDVLEIKNLDISAEQTAEAMLTLETRDDTELQKLWTAQDCPERYSVHFTPRCPVSDLQKLRVGDIFDFEACILPCSQPNRITICVDVSCTSLDASTPLLAIIRDDIALLTSVQPFEIWSFKDLECLSTSEHSIRTGVCVTSKTSGCQMQSQEQLNVIRSLYASKQRDIEKHVIEWMSSL